jgi:hypothetical protein
VVIGEYELVELGAKPNQGEPEERRSGEVETEGAVRGQQPGYFGLLLDVVQSAQIDLSPWQLQIRLEDLQRLT